MGCLLLAPYSQRLEIEVAGATSPQSLGILVSRGIGQLGNACRSSKANSYPQPCAHWWSKNRHASKLRRFPHVNSENSRSLFGAAATSFYVTNPGFCKAKN